MHAHDTSLFAPTLGARRGVTEGRPPARLGLVSAAHPPWQTARTWKGPAWWAAATQRWCWPAQQPKTGSIVGATCTTWGSVCCASHPSYAILMRCAEWCVRSVALLCPAGGVELASPAAGHFWAMPNTRGGDLRGPRLARGDVLTSARESRDVYGCNADATWRHPSFAACGGRQPSVVAGASRAAWVTRNKRCPRSR